MHICYIADARSPIAKNWIAYFVAKKHRVTVISSYPCRSDEIPGARIIEFPFAFSGFSGALQNGNGHRLGKITAELRTSKLLHLSTKIRTWLAPVDIRRKTGPMAELIAGIQPDLVHAMRLPFEGYLAAAAVTERPLVASVWGNDFTLFADSSQKLRTLTAQALCRADALFCDCQRDLRMAVEYGFSREKPRQVVPGGGGIQTGFYFNLWPDRALMKDLGIPEGLPLVINPRGARAYVRNDVFFQAIPLVLKEVPEAFFLAVGMKGNPTAERWLRSAHEGSSMKLLPSLSREQLASLFAASTVSVSPSSHDGTPNTLLEAMACGCVPVAGNIESLREWITDGENGILCDESDPASLASAMIRALKDQRLRSQAKLRNRTLTYAHADYNTCMVGAEFLYAELLNRRRLGLDSRKADSGPKGVAEIPGS